MAFHITDVVSGNTDPKKRLVEDQIESTEKELDVLEDKEAMIESHEGSATDSTETADTSSGLGGPAETA